VESNLGQGSCFHFTAKLGVTADLLQDRISENVVAGVPVLVVDDNATNRRILTGLLRKWQIVVVSAAESATDALSQMRCACESGRPFRLVVTDVHMPGMDGFELAERAKDAPRLADAVIVMLTSGERPGDLARCHELGITTYLVKPVRRFELLACVTRALTDPASGEKIGRPVVSIPFRSPQASTAALVRILLAEDNVVNQHVARGILQKAGYPVVVAGNGQEALAALRRQTFDLVLMDIQMPGVDGFEATAAIRTNECGTKTHLHIIAMTAHAMKGDREKCLAAGMDGYISKPIRASDLLELVANYSKRERYDESLAGSATV
jgi:two-component system sensor histidine kinase/response regulator